jgi:hypothetical protein
VTDVQNREIPAPRLPDVVASAAGAAHRLRRRRRRLVWALVATAPLVAEFVSGNLPISYVWLLILYAPLYGGGAVLVREVGRRSASPWPVMFTLGLTYGAFEEAFVSVSLFNPGYAGLRLLDFGWLPALGIGAWWTVFVVVLHAVWSICVPIVLVESFADELADQPWLTRRGIVGAATAMFVGALGAAAITQAEDPFLPSPGQALGASAALFALLALAWWWGRRPRGWPAPVTGETHRSAAPAPWAVGLAAAVAAVGFVAGAAQTGPPAVTLVGYAGLGVAAAVVLRHWVRRPGWGPRHRLALATGLLVPHIAFAFAQAPLVDVPIAVDLGGKLVFAAATALAVVLAARRLRRPVASRPRGRARGAVATGPR